MVAELARKRIAIERRVGKAACRMAEMRRRKVVPNGNLVAAFGMLVAQREPQDPAFKNKQQGTDVQADSEVSPA
jgi:hypothetical protein